MNSGHILLTIAGEFLMPKLNLNLHMLNKNMKLINYSSESADMIDEHYDAVKWEKTIKPKNI